ncbi:hypothetical protein CVT26_004554, partial [Gymnopilus dilepis]
MSMQDRGGRNKWGEYSLAGSSSSAGGAGASGSSGSAKPSPGASSGPFAQPKYSGGYVPARTPSPTPVANPVAPISTQAANLAAERQRQQAAQYHAAQAVYAQSHAQGLSGGPGQHAYPSRSSSLGEATPVVPVPAVSAIPATSSPVPSSSTPIPSSSTTQTQTQIPSLSLTTRVRALHTFTPSEPGELAFEKGDIIKVVDRGYKDWWRGQLKGRTGIFPVNYVFETLPWLASLASLLCEEVGARERAREEEGREEPLPEPTPAELTLEAQSEAQVFSQAVQVEKLLAMLRALDPEKDNLADNEEIQELYRQCMGLRPKIVRLIERYSQKR